MTDKHVETFREIVTDIVTSRVAAETLAAHPLGLVDRSFTGITGQLVMANWPKLARHRVEDVVRAICFAKRDRAGNVKMPRRAL